MPSWLGRSANSPADYTLDRMVMGNFFLAPAGAFHLIRLGLVAELVNDNYLLAMDRGDLLMHSFVM